MLVTFGTWRVGKMMVATQCLAVYPLYDIKDVSKSNINFVKLRHCLHLLSKSIFSAIFFDLMCASWLQINIFPSSLSVQFCVLIQLSSSSPTKKIMDHYTFLRNCSPTPPLSQHQHLLLT